MKIGRFALLTVCGFAVFALTMTFAPLLSAWGNHAVRGALLVLSGGLWIATRRDGALHPYRPVFFAYFTAVAAASLGYYFGDYGLALFHLTVQTPAGIAVAKASQALLILVAVIVIAWLSGEDLASLYIRKGRLMIGLGVGLFAAAVCVFLALKQPSIAGTSAARLWALAPWMALFILPNAFMEEVLFRGLFLGRYEPLMGKWLALLSTALVFAAAHMQISYAPDTLISFLAVVFGFGLAWGWLMQMSKSLWGSLLFHAGADMIIILPVFKSFGAI